MNNDKYFKLMDFPREWLTLGMYPDELAVIQVSGYQPGNERASEHDRCGAFHWWLRQEPSEQQLKYLMNLASIDPDRLMGDDVKKYIRKAKNYTGAVEQ